MRNPLLLAAILSMVSASAAVAQTGPEGWSDPDGLPVALDVGGMIATSPDTMYLVSGTGASWTLHRCDLSPSPTWTQKTGLAAPAGSGGAIVRAPAGDAIFAALGPSYAVGNRGFYRYDIAANTWDSAANFPVDQAFGLSLASSSARIFALGGMSAGGTTFHEYTQVAGGTGMWRALSATPAAVGHGAALTCPDPDGDFLYALRGGGQKDFWRYSISADSWQVMPFLPSTGGVIHGSALGVGPAATLYCVTGATFTEFWAYSTATAAWSRIDSGENPVPGPTGFGASIVWPAGRDTVYIARGGSRDLWRYSRTAGRFQSALDSPGFASTKGIVAGADANSLYTLEGGNARGFRRYDIGANRWSSAPDAPAGVAPTGSLVRAGGGFLYAVQGDLPGGLPDRGFWRFDPAANRWESRASFPDLDYMSLGPATWGGGDVIYVSFSLYSSMDGSEGRLARYSIADDEWTLSATLTPGSDGLAHALAWPGSGDLLYAYVPFAWPGFRVYCMSLDRWDVTSSGASFSPARGPLLSTGYGACLAAGRGSGELLAFPGSYSKPGAFWSYSLGADVWTELKTAPGSTGLGASMVVPGGSNPNVYVIPGYTRLFWSYGPEATAAPPSQVAQLAPDGVTAVAEGGALRTDGFIVRAVGSHPAHRWVGLEAEVVPDGSAFAGIATVASELLPSGSTLNLSIRGLAPGAYRWQARTVGATGPASAWMEFGTGAMDIRLTVNNAPVASSLTQRRLSDGAILGSDGGTSNGVRLEAVLSDPDGDAVRWEVEVKPWGTAFQGLPTAGADAASIALLLPPGLYSWQARPVDELGLAAAAWTKFGGDDRLPDFEILPPGSGNDTSSCLQSGIGTGALPLLAAGMALALLVLRR